ncbi:MAG TPA: pitrilysin family protein [Candidatus Kapabacteria bacterium]|nr:pitrilysin family protein [Candidatus Kapabacteria bacterium]
MKKIACALLFTATIACAANIPPVQDFYVDGVHVLLRNDVQNNVVSAILFLQGGSINLRNMNPLLETYALAVPGASGPTTMTKEEYRQQTSGLAMVINTNAGRDYSDMTCVCVKDYWDNSWKIFSDIALHPRYDTTEFERIRRSTILNIDARASSPDEYVGYLADSLFFRNHLYYNPATVEETRALTLDSIEAYHDALFIKSRMLLVVVGNIAKEDLAAKIHASLGTMPEGSYYDFGYRQPAQCDTSEFMTRYMKIPTFYIEGYFGAPKQTDFDYWASVVAASMLSSRMFEELRTKRNLTYAASAEIVSGKLCYGKVYVTTEYPDTCLALIRQIVEHMMTHPPSQTEINYHINLWITQLGLREETNISQADAIGVAQIETGTWTNAYTIIDRIREVYPSDIVRCAQRYFRNINFAVLGDTTKPTHVGNYLW